MVGKMSKVLIRTRNGEFQAELDDSDVSNAIWLSNSLKFDINMLEGMIYAEIPTKFNPPAEEGTTQMEVGDIAYWPGPMAICIFYGPTVLSGEDKKPVAPFPMVKIGHVIGDCSGLEHAGDRQSMTIVQSF